MKAIKIFIYIISALGLLFSINNVFAADIYANSAKVTVINKSRYNLGVGLYGPVNYYSSPFPITIPISATGSFTYYVNSPSTAQTTKTSSSDSAGTNQIFFGATDGSTVDSKNGCTFYYSLKNCAIPTPVSSVGIFAGGCGVCSSSYDTQTNSCNFTFGFYGCS